MEIQHGPFIFLLARAVLGILFFFQAYDKIFRIGLQEVMREVSFGAGDKGIPGWFAKLSVFVSSYIELIGGLLLILGLFTWPVMYIFGVHLMMVFIAFGYLKGVWDLQHVFPRFVILVFLFMLPESWNVLSLDSLMGGSD